MPTDTYSGAGSGTHNELLTVSEAAAYVGFSISSLRRWDRKGELVVYRTPGNLRRYKRSDLDEIRRQLGHGAA